MGEFSVNLTRLSAKEATFTSLSKRLDRIASNNALFRNDANVPGLASTLSTISKDISDLSKSVGTLGTSVEKVVSAYSSTESSLISNSGRVAGGSIFRQYVMAPHL